MSTRRIALPSLITLTTLALAACSPVVLPGDDTDTDAGTGTGDGTADDTGAEESGGAEDGSSPSDVPTACIDLEPRVLAVFEANCAKCHGAGSPAQGGIDYILDLDLLMAQSKVIPGNPEESRVYDRMSAAMSPMPPTSETQRPTAADIESVGKWIDECAGVQSCAEQPFISRDQILTKINQDLSTVDLQALPFTRYFTFVHLHNAGWCDAEIEPFRQALAKLVNSLSQETQIKAPVAIDPDQRLIYRIDISDYDWDADVIDGIPEVFHLSKPTEYFPNDEFEDDPDDPRPFDAVLELGNRSVEEYRDKWEMIADQNPYTVEYLGDLALNIKKQTLTNFPIMQGDAFVDVASRSPLYYDILGIPRRSAQLKPGEDQDCIGAGPASECLEEQLGINILKNISDEFEKNDGVVARAGFKKSDVSDFNRVIERHLFTNANNRSFWISYDFAGQSGKQNITVNPLDFDFDGGELIFTLPNGFQGYMLTNADGDRLDEGPLNIVQDESQRDFLVRNGVSCMGCHSSGMIKANDDIRWALDNNMSEGNFDAIERDQIRDLYPTRDQFNALLDEDIRRFNDSMALTSLPIGGEKEQVLTTFLSFDENVALRRVGAEFDLTEMDMVQVVGKLSDDLDDLGEGNTIQRRDFTNNFAVSACILKLGCTSACPGDGDSPDVRACTSIDVDGDGIVDEL